MIKALAIVVVILLVAGVLVRWARLLDKHFVFLPEREMVGAPGDVGLTFEDVFFSTSDGVTLHGWFVPAESNTTLLWFHGNAGNISHRIDGILDLHEWLGVNVFIFDYRGYGLSQGKPSEKGTYLDAEAALGYLRGHHATGRGSKIVLFGQSMGSAVAVETAIRHRVHAVILEAPFTSLIGMARSDYPYLPVRLLIQLVESRYDSLSKISRVRSPMLISHGDQDAFVPIEMGRKLFDAASEPKRFYTVEGAGHNDMFYVGKGAYFETLRLFIGDPTAGSS
ncbi:MAG: alpha/beta hydrolase [Dehalococcoidia bacterium]